MNKSKEISRQEKNAPLLDNQYSIQHTEDVAEVPIPEHIRRESIEQNPYHDEDNMLLFKLTPYLTPQACQNLHHYVYKGEDNAIVYKHITRPLAGYIVDNYIPEWVAPNVISITAFLLSVTPSIV